MLVAFSGFALAEKIIVQHEVSQDKQKDNVKLNVAKENRLSSKRIRDRIDSNIEIKGTVNDRMIRYKQFNDGEGEVKTKK